MHFIILSFIIVSAIIVLAIMIVLIYKLATVKGKIVYDGVPLQAPAAANEIMDRKIRVLLLYPKDCHAFMESMNTFRKLLKAVNNFEVSKLI